MRYYIPSKAGDFQLDTKAIKMSIEPEDDFTRMEMFLSLDANFYLIEEKPATHIMLDGIGIKFGVNDFGWQVKSYVYLIINIYKE